MGLDHHEGVTVSVLVLGGGPAGLSAALLAREFGAGVTLIEAKQIADLVPAFPTFTEGITVAAQMIVRQMGLAPSAPTWGEVRAADPAPRA